MVDQPSKDAIAIAAATLTSAYFTQPNQSPKHQHEGAIVEMFRSMIDSVERSFPDEPVETHSSAEHI